MMNYEFLKLYQHFCVDLASCQVVGHGILLVGDVSNPIIAVDIVDAKDVQTVNTNPHARMLQRWFAIGFSDGQIAHTDVGTFVGRCTELLVLQSAVGRSEG